MRTNILRALDHRTHLGVPLRRWLRLLYPKVPVSHMRTGYNIDNPSPKSSRLRLLFAIDSLTGGGAERIMCQVANGLEASQFEIQIAQTLGAVNVQDLNDPIKVINLITQIPADLYYRRSQHAVIERWTASIISLVEGEAKTSLPDLELDIHNFRIMSLALGRYVNAWEPDLILSFLPNTNLLSLFAKAWYGYRTPVICADHNHLSSELSCLPWAKLRRRFIRRHYPTASRHIAVAPEEADDLVDKFNVPNERVVTIPNGIDIDRIRDLAVQPSAEDDNIINTDDFLIVSVGRLSWQKGHDTLLHALARLRTRGWRLILLGEGEEHAPLEKLARQLAISDRVHFLGWRKNPYFWMHKSDVFVLSSRWEGWPLVLLEALALGLPIVATDCPGATRRIVDGGRFGKLVPKDEPAALSAALDELLGSERLRGQFSTVAKARANDFGLSAMTEQYKNLFLDVVNSA